MTNLDKRLDKIEQALEPGGTRIFVIFDTDDPNLFELPNRPGELFTEEQIKQIQIDMGFNIEKMTTIHVTYGDDANGEEPISQD